MKPPQPGLPAFGAAPRAYARLAGWLYLAIILLGLHGELMVRGTLVVPGDAAATAARIAASPGLWRSGIAADLLMQLADVPVTVVLYLLLRPVGPALSLLAAALNMVQTAVLALNKLTLLVPLLLPPSAPAGAAQRDALVMLAIRLHDHGFAIGLVFFGLTCVLLGGLIVRSGFLPRVLGVLLAVAGVCYLVNSFALLLAPALAQVLFPAVLAPAFVGELAFSLWLIARGVDPVRWQARAAAAK